jgi:hypothetical protein
VKILVSLNWVVIVLNGVLLTFIISMRLMDSVRMSELYLNFFCDSFQSIYLP